MRRARCPEALFAAKIKSFSTEPRPQSLWEKCRHNCRRVRLQPPDGRNPVSGLQPNVTYFVGFSPCRYQGTAFSRAVQAGKESGFSPCAL